jgi:hypothetical protein
MWRLHVTQKKPVTIYNCTQSHNPEDQEGPGVQILARRPDILTVVFEVFLSPSIQMPGQYFKLGDASFNILSNSSFTYHPFIRRYIVWVTIVIK